MDTHVNRVSKRLDLADEDDNVLEVENKLNYLFPKDSLSKIHHQLVFFGRYKCKETVRIVEKTKMKTGFLILHYNATEITKKCVTSIQNLDGGKDAIIIIVDNASSNGSGQELLEEYQKISHRLPQLMQVWTLFFRDFCTLET